MANRTSPLTVSVALCTHNGAEFVAEQVRSILAQTAPVAEIVLSDDGSTDDTVAIVESTVGSWPTPRPALRIIRNARALGVTANFEQAARACSGDLIALCDQDDSWHPDKISTVVGIFRLWPAISLVHSDAALVDGDGARLPGTLLSSLDALPGELREIHDGLGFRTLLRRNLVTGATTVFRSRQLEPAFPFAEGWVHDEWLAIIAAALGRTEIVEEELIDYRQHGSNLIGARSLTLREKFSRLGEPRTERNQRLLMRSQNLVDRLQSAGATTEVLALARGKLAHERARFALPRTRILRVAPILGAWASGRYRDYGRGTIDVARDLLQPPD